MKEDDKPMERLTREPLPLRQAPRCLARTRAGTPCQKAASTGKKRCRMHGGATPRAGPLRTLSARKNCVACFCPTITSEG
jgi:hypothetical protein